MLAGGERLGVAAVRRGATTFGGFRGGGHDNQGADWAVGSVEVIHGGLDVGDGGSVAIAISWGETLIVIRYQPISKFALRAHAAYLERGIMKDGRVSIAF